MPTASDVRDVALDGTRANGLSAPASDSASPEDRARLADQLRRMKPVVAEAVTDEFFRRHPHWDARYGLAGRRLGIENAAFHLDFLAGALEAGATIAFEDYAHWVVRLLRARGLAAESVAENFRQIERLLAPALTEAERALLAEFIRVGSRRARAAETDPPAANQFPLGEAAQLYLRALLDGRRRDAARIALGTADRAARFEDVYFDVVQAAQCELGALWERNEISVAQEHMATAITQWVLACLSQRLERPARTRGRLVLAGVEGELHQVGASVVADLLEADGWDVRFLGTNTPTGGVLDIVEDHEADVLGISVTMLFHLSATVRLVRAARERFGPRLRILLGGRALKTVPHLAVAMGADGWGADGRVAMALARGDPSDPEPHGCR